MHLSINSTYAKRFGLTCPIPTNFRALLSSNITSLHPSAPCSRGSSCVRTYALATGRGCRPLPRLLEFRILFDAYYSTLTSSVRPQHQVARELEYFRLRTFVHPLIVRTLKTFETPGTAHASTQFSPTADE